MVSFPAPAACTPPGAAFALAAAAVLGALSGSGGGVLVDESVADYLEDAPQARPVALVRAHLLRRAEGLFLRVSVSAEGPRVDPVPGLQGVRGHNARTAEELHRLLRDGGLRFVLRGGSPEAELEGRVAVARAGHLPERRIAADGTLVLLGESPAEWPLEVVFEGGPLAEGEWRAWVLAEDVPRLRAVVLVRADSGSIAELASLGQFHEPRSPR